MPNGQRYDRVRRIWIERTPTWRRCPLPATSAEALRKPSQKQPDPAPTMPSPKND